MRPREVSLVEAKDWRSVADFEDTLTSQQPTFDIDCHVKLRVLVAITPCDLFFTFLPVELVEAAFPSWRSHAEANGRKVPKLHALYVFEASVVASENDSEWAPPKEVLRGRGVASGDPDAIRSCGMSDRFKGRALVRDTNKKNICMMCGYRTQIAKGCGRAICGAVPGELVSCWACLPR
jgi:hypothetical protein